MISRRPDGEIGSSSQGKGLAGPSELQTPDTIFRPNLLERAMLGIGCVCAVMIFGFSMADIVLRSASIEFFLAGEANAILLAWMIFLAMAYATRTRSHISLEFLDGVLPEWLRTVIRFFGYLVMLGYIAVLSWYCGQLAWTSYMNEVRSSSILRWPVIYAQMGVLVGLAVMAVTQCLILVADLRSGGRGHPPHHASLT